MKLGTTSRRIAAILLGMLCVVLAGYAFAYLYRAYNPHNPFNVRLALDGLGVPAHLFGGGLALLLVPWQLSARIRRRWPHLHRIGGWLSVAAILIGAIGAFSLATQTALGGAVTGWGFGTLAMVWLLCTGLGIRFALVGDIPRHRRWMGRCIALTTSSITLRLMLAAGAVLHLPMTPVYIAAAWTAWPVNLLIGEFLMRRFGQAARLDRAGRRSATPSNLLGALEPGAR